MTRELALYIDPPSHHFLRDRLFNVNDRGFFNGDSVNLPWARLRDFLAARGVAVHTADFLPAADDGARRVYVSTGMLDKYARLARRPDITLSAFFAMECPVVDPGMYRGLQRAQRFFKRIYSWSDSRSLERYVGGPLRCLPFCWPQSFSDVHEPIWNRTERDFLVIITAHKLPRDYRQELYTERLRAIAFFSRTNEIDLYGPGWDGPPYRMRIGWMPGTAQLAFRALERRWNRVHLDPLLAAARRVYRGVALSKSETLGRYTFCLCFENQLLKGWISEKIFDCFYAGTIPIYLGATDVESHIPPDCFIDMRDFAGYPELTRFLKSLSSEDIRRYRENARAFLRSSRFRPHSTDAFIELFARMIEEDTGVSVGEPLSV